MSDKLFCPFCQQELQEDVGYDGDYSCPNCREPYFGSPELWQELGRTRKALDVAVDALDASKTLADIAGFKMLVAGIDKALEQINEIKGDK